MSAVSIVHVQDGRVDAAVRQAVALAGGLPVSPGAAVLLKPNVVGPSSSGSGHVTDARITAAVARLALEQGAGRVVIGEGSSVGYDFPGRRDSMQCMEASGTAAVARELGLPLVDLNRDERVEVYAEGAYVMDRFSIAQTTWEADVIVDLPVIKTHVRTGITCGLKNMKGVLPGNEKKRTHRLGLDRAIVDLNRVVKPHFTVVDAIVGMQGTHAGPEDRVPMGRIVAGADVVAVDAVCAAIAGFDVSQIHHVRLAAEAGLGVADLAQIEVRGETIEAVRRPFVTYRKASRERFGAVTIVERDACTGCMGEIVSTFLYLNRAGFGDRLADLALILGTPEEVPPLPGTPVVVGKCALAHRELGIYVPGCPPHGIAITDAACEALRIDAEVVHRAIAELHNF
jgi:uncharacterized protein (DUF362 family)